jgi:uncharacterized membrane protein YtjA (UPF0391 family)
VISAIDASVLARSDFHSPKKNDHQLMSERGLKQKTPQERRLQDRPNVGINISVRPQCPIPIWLLAVAGTSSISPKLDQRFLWSAIRRLTLEEWPMTILKWALIFFLVSVVAGLFGFTDISAASAEVARFLFYVFVVIFLVLLILGLTIFRV